MSKIHFTKTISISSLLTLVLAVAIPGLQAAAQDLKADLIFNNGDIHTPDGFEEAIAVANGVILAVGDNDEIDRYRDAGTEVIDLAGAGVVPGLHDMHVHPLGAGLQEYQCRFAQGLPPQQVFDAVAACVDAREEGEWVSGGQWDAASFGETPPHRSMLDQIAPNNPVVLTDISGHSAWANSLALELSGVDSDTPNPPGGIIERDARGEPTGLLRESAAGLVRGRVPGYTPEQQIEGLAKALDIMLAHGITSFTDAGVSEGSMRAYAALADQGRLKQRVRGCIMWRPAVFNANDAAAANDPIRRANLYARDRFSPDCIKMVLDGVPTDGHTAAMVEPYADHSHSDEVGRETGLLMIPQDQLNDAVIDLDARGYTVKFHAAGDAAVRAALDAVAAAREANGFSGLLHDSGHNSFVKMNDIQRARDIAATLEMSPYIWYPNPIIPDIAKAIGPERMERWIPVKDAIDAGALVVPGSDWPVVPEVNPWIGIETLVTRQQLGGGGERLGAQERISLEDAMAMFTVNSAVQMGMRHQTGSIEPGLLADFIVVDRNPFKAPVTDIHKTKVLKTVINGEVVYESE